MAALTLDIAASLSQVSPEAWDALGSPDDPFTEHAFLLALEESGSVDRKAGWLPQHLLLRDGEGLVGAMPLYLKNHSYGEYIFDWGWADAAQRAGLRYYPKLVCAAPFTPATGPRLRVAEGPQREAREQALLHGALQVAKESRASSLHVLFCPEDQARRLAAQGLVLRKTWQYHWENPGVEDFEQWLGLFRARRRKETRRERRLPPGVAVVERPGDALSPAEQQDVRALYEDTCDKRGGSPYLTPTFFEMLWTRLAHRCRVLLALEGEQVVAMALLFQRGSHLYGRYWGCRPGYEGLHFELCYHRPIELCLAQGWTRFEAGAQGEHKIKRGLVPQPTWSAHWLQHPGLMQAVADACAREEVLADAAMRSLSEHGPFQRGDLAPLVPGG